MSDGAATCKQDKAKVSSLQGRSTKFITTNDQPFYKTRSTLYDESIFKSKEAKEKPCRIDEACMEKDEGAEARR